MSGFYCDKCGKLHARLPGGFVTCSRCGGMGLRGYDRIPRPLRCPEHPTWFGWDDGGVNDDLRRHRLRDHPATGPTSPAFRIIRD